jgi:hypothetical protein
VHSALSGANGEDNLRVWALCPTCLDEGGEPPCRFALRREWLRSREEEKRPELRAWVVEPASEGALRCRLAPELRLASARVLWGAAAAPQPADLDPKDIMLRLDAQPAEALGAGSVGQVFRASVRGVRVVVKLPKQGQRLEAAELIALLHLRQAGAHANLVQFLGCAEVGGRLGLVLREVEEEDMNEVIARAPLSASELARAGLHAARGLAHLHAHGILHGDVAARNLMRRRGDGVVLVSDLGLAKVLARGAEWARLDPAGSFPMPWLPPESFLDAHEFGPPSDVWMWGATMVELATRRRPHEGCSEPEIAEGRLFERVGELRGCGNVCDALRELVGRCLRPRPEQRPSAEKVTLPMQDCLAALGEFAQAAGQRRELLGAGAFGIAPVPGYNDVPVPVVEAKDDAH